MTAMCIQIQSALGSDHDPDASDLHTRGFDAHNGVGYGGMHRIMVGPADRPGASTVLEPVAAAAGSRTLVPTAVRPTHRVNVTQDLRSDHD
jgi:hypothetical protein